MSPVFREMALQRSKDSFVRLDMSHLSQEAWECITQFHFNNEACLSLTVVADVLEVSEWHQMDRLKNYCCEFLTSCCTFENCLQVMRIAKQFRLEGPAEKAMHIFSSRLQAGCSLEDFLCLEKIELLELLEKEELVSTEDDVCGALLAWMEVKMADANTCSELFQHVRLEKVSDDFLTTDVLYHSVPTQSPGIQAKVQEEVRRRMNRSGQRQVCEVSTLRSVRNINERMVVVGRNSQGQLRMYHWSPPEMKWINFPNLDRKSQVAFSSAACEGTVFVTGGFEGTRTETHLFDLNSGTWTAGAYLLQGRRFHGMAVIRDRVYVVAGYDDDESFSSVEVFSQTTRRWTPAGHLTVATHGCGVAALGDTILVAGGDTHESESLIQTFNVETRTAAVLDVRLPRPMRHVRAASLGNTAFFVGSEGDLVQITEVVGEFRMTSHVQLQGFGDEKWFWFGLHVTDTCVRVIGGNWTQSVVSWNHRGEKVENDKLSDLPEGIDIYGSFEVDGPIP